MSTIVERAEYIIRIASKDSEYGLYFAEAELKFNNSFPVGIDQLSRNRLKGLYCGLVRIVYYSATSCVDEFQYMLQEFISILTMRGSIPLTNSLFWKCFENTVFETRIKSKYVSELPASVFAAVIHKNIPE